MDQELIRSNKSYLAAAFIVMGLAVGLGAFGAHGLEGKVDLKALATYKTGVQYHLIHGLAMLACALGSFHGLKLKSAFFLFLFGITIFSGGCYLYTFTGLKAYAMVVPIGGVSFLGGWFFGAYKLLK